MSFDTEIFNGKTLSDIFADVYTNSEKKREQINQFVANMVKLIRTPEDAAVLGPVIQSFLEVNVKNDEHIVRLAQIAQRLVSVSSKSTESSMLLTEEEKAQLLGNIKRDFESVIAEQDDMEDTLQRTMD
jgi:predicted NAD-dependent protein-ADP-ribosyltransferase YbiA (DUF1768 family)